MSSFFERISTGRRDNILADLYGETRERMCIRSLTACRTSFSILLDDIWKCEKCFVILGEKNNLGRRDNFKLSDFIRLNHYGSSLIVSNTVSSMTKIIVYKQFTTFSIATIFRNPLFPASRYAELVSGGHLPTISGAHISAPAGPCILRQQNMERQVGRQG